MPHQKLFSQLLIFLNLYQHAKNEAVSLICYGKMLDLKILQSEWLRAFWPISQEQHFLQLEDLYRNMVNNIHFFIIEQIQGKSITNFLFKFKKSNFCPIFGPFPQFFRAKNVFPKTLACIT